MEEERIYKLEDGTEMVLIDKAIYNDKRYLLVIDNKTNEVEIAYEEDGCLNYLDENDSIYNELIMLFSKKTENI